MSSLMSDEEYAAISKLSGTFVWYSASFVAYIAFSPTVTWECYNVSYIHMPLKSIFWDHSPKPLLQKMSSYTSAMAARKKVFPGRYPRNRQKRRLSGHSKNVVFGESPAVFPKVSCFGKIKVFPQPPCSPTHNPPIEDVARPAVSAIPESQDPSETPFSIAHPLPEEFARRQVSTEVISMTKYFDEDNIHSTFTHRWYAALQNRRTSNWNRQYQLW